MISPLQYYKLKRLNQLPTWVWSFLLFQPALTTPSLFRPSSSRLRRAASRTPSLFQPSKLAPVLRRSRAVQRNSQVFGATVVVVGGGAPEDSSPSPFFLKLKDYFEILYAQLRCKVEPSFAERSLITHTDYLPDVRIINCHATGVIDKEVLCEDGNSVSYDYLVIATGHVDSALRNRNDRLQEFKQDREDRVLAVDSDCRRWARRC